MMQTLVVDRYIRRIFFLEGFLDINQSSFFSSFLPLQPFIRIALSVVPDQKNKQQPTN
jgi:hypothetical protein